MKTRRTHRTDRANQGHARGSRLARQRRGSVIILAIGALAALAIVAIAYTVAVRTDRASATSHAASLDGRRQAEAVAGDISSLLAADLFGNKVVTADMPRYIDSNYVAVAGTSVGAIRLWPRAFEDGEFIDYPRVEKGALTHTFGLSFLNEDPGAVTNPGNDGWRLDARNPSAGGVGEPSVAPVQDDAWLASTEPVASAFATTAGAWDTWPQITNMRSAYRWRREAGGGDYYWDRDDGRYADLARFFLTPRAESLRRGDPDADLMSARDNQNDPLDWEDEFAPLSNTPDDWINGPALGVNQRVFDFQINALGADDRSADDALSREFYFGQRGDAPRPPHETSERPHDLDGLDTRYWADTDGDLRPDARWQEIGALGNAAGMRWVAAVRIVDLSALLNVNTAIDSGLLSAGGFAGFSPPFPPQPNQVPPLDPLGVADTVAAGATPADVDLFRALFSADQDARSQPGAWSGTIQTGVVPVGGGLSHYNPLAATGEPGVYSANRRAFREHLDKGLRLTELINSAYFDGEFSPPGQPGSTTLRYDDFANPAFWRFTRDERSRIYTLFGAAPFERQSFAKAYDFENEIELRTYWGANHDKVLSPLEQRLDFGYMPGMASVVGSYGNPLPAPEVLTGPLRAARATDVERTFQYVERPGSLPALGNDDAQGRPSVYDLRDDTRRLLTTYSGVGDFSPVPVLNDATETVGSVTRHVYGDRAVNRKVRLTDFPVNLGSPSSATVEARKFEMIRNAFEAFTWALAPLATDKPVMPPLTAANVGVNAASSAMHYGGGPNSPAAALIAAGNPDPGASYALLRAASLAINLADAQDDENPGAAAGAATVETPTVARLFNVVQTDPTAAPHSATDQVGVVELGTRFSHGDLPRNDTLCPPAYMGAFQAGVTLIGLDRQPFLRSASTLSVYENTLEGIVGNNSPTDDTPLVVDTGDVTQQFGSILAVELGNPWPADIDVAGLWVAIANDQGWIEFLIDSANTIVPAGDSVAFYLSTSRIGAIEWANEVEPVWEAAAISASTGAQAPRKVSGNPVYRDTAGVIVTMPDAPVMFQTMATGAGRQGVVMLFRDQDNQRLLLDRMSSLDTAPFPGTYLGSVQIPKPAAAANPGDRWQGRIASASGMRRPSEPATPEDRGFPAYVVESPAENHIVRFASPGVADWYGTWISGEIVTYTELLTAAGYTIGYDPTNLANTAVTGASPTWLPSFQLFVPDTALASPSELQMLCTFTHLFVHDTSGAISDASIAAAAAPQPDPLLGPYWITIAEQLGDAMHAAYDTVQAPGASNRNPYLGALDPSRFTLRLTPGATSGELGPVATLPDAMAIPLAARVFDCFEALPIPSGLAQGRVNINTAPEKVLRSLPFLSPWQDINGTTSTAMFQGTLADATGFASAATPSDRAALAIAYRDADVNTAFGNGVNGRSQSGSGTNLAGLRAVGERDGMGATLNRPARGLIMTGELSLLAQWGVDGTGSTPTLGGVGPFTAGSFLNEANFAELGYSSGTPENDGNPTTVSGGANVPVDKILDLRSNAASALGAKAFDPIDDAEERLAIYRALANTVTTRSDVYAAWFIIRGYDPRAIESIELPVGVNVPDEEKAALLKKLQPAHESRWLAIFDRSNVREAADRPRLLLLTELPVR